VILAAAFGFDPACTQQPAVKPADEDSAVTVRSAPRRFMPVPGDESAGTLITATVYQALRAPTLVAWRTVVVDEAGRPVRIVAGVRPATPGKPLQITQLWNGRDDRGRMAPTGTYRFSVRVRLAPAAGVTGPIDFERIADVAGVEEIPSAVGSVEVTDAPAEGQDHRGAWITLSAGPPPTEPGFPFNFYFGTLHTQTSYTDGGHANDANCLASTSHVSSDFTPAQAYAYARNTAKVDFLGISDHNHLFDSACPGCSSATVIGRYHDGLAAAAAATADGSFVAIYGMEWGYISNDNFPNEGHINLFEVPQLFGWKSGFYEVYTDPLGANYPAMYTTANANPSPWGAVGSFNHPNTAVGGDFNKFGYTPDGDDLIALTAVLSGPATGYSTTEADTGYRYAGPNRSTFIDYDTYNKILGAGFHVAPDADQDVHCSNYGQSTHDRTVVLAPALTKAAIMDAIAHRRVYATSDHAAQVVFTLKDSAGITHYMGEGYNRTAGPVSVGGPITLHVSHFNPAGIAVSSIKIFEPVPNNAAGESTLVASGTISPLDFTFTPTVGKHTYYAYLTQADTNEIWTAPIWISETGTPPLPDFSLTMSPGTVPVTAGGSGTSTVTITPLNGFGGTVTFSTSTLPSGVSASFNPTSVTTSGTSTLTLSTSSTTTPGSYAITVTGTSGTLSHSATITLQVTAPTSDFSLTMSPNTVPVTAGSSGTSTATITPLNGFTGTVTFSTSSLPSDVSASFNPTSVTTSGTSTFTLNTSSTTTPGSYAITVTGASGSLSHSATVTLVVQDFSLSVTPPSQSVAQGASTTYTANITRNSGFSGSVGFSVSGLPGGASGTFSPNPTTGSSSTLSVSTSASTPAGSYPLTITGTSGALTRITNATLSVTAAPSGDFSLSITPGSVSVKAGGPASYTVNIARTGGFAGNISLSASGLPASATVSFTPNPAGGTSSALTISTGPSTADTVSYPFSVTGTSGTLSRSANATLTILQGCVNGSGDC
jgi:hypothetical protein